MNQNQTSPQIDNKWNEAVSKFSGITDALGKPIDSKILSAVVGLNLNKIHTTASCEGHIQHGLSYPWIEYGSEKMNDYYISELKVVELYRQGLKTKDKFLHDSLLKENNEMRKQNHKKYRTEFMRISELLIPMLNDFNRNNADDINNILIIDDFRVCGRIIINNSFMQESYSDNIKKQNLTIYQEKMFQFARYLKQRLL